MHRSHNKVWYSQLSSLEITAQELLDYAIGYKVWLFTGALASGKTTLIKAICTQLGVRDYVSSPSFAIVHEYALPDGDPVYHLDAYRLPLESHAHILALDDLAYFEAGYYCFIEWPAKISYLLPSVYFAINIAVQPNGFRKLQTSLVR